MAPDALAWWVHAAVRSRARRKLDLYNATNAVNMDKRHRDAFLKQLEFDLKSGLEEESENRPETKEEFEARLKRIDAAFAMIGGGRRRKG